MFGELGLGFIVIQFLTGLARGMVLFIIASGFTLVMGITKILNIYHGTLFMLGAYVTYSICSIFANFGCGFWLGAILVAPIAVALLGVVIERYLFRPLYRRELHYIILVMFALILMSGDLVKFTWDTQILCPPTPAIFVETIPIMGWRFPTYYLFVIVLGPIISFALWFTFYRTRLGIIVRATASDPDMTNALGINVPLIFTGVFGAGAWLAGLAGGLVAGMYRLDVGMDLTYIVLCMVVIVIGGMGSFRGALLGAFIIGEIEAFARLGIEELAMIFPYVIMAIILIARPEGLFGKKLGEV